MKDYYATLRIQQGRLKAAMQTLGIKSAAELARRSGVSQYEIGALLNFRTSPRNKKGKWKQCALTLAKTLGWEPSDLFPDHLDHEIPTNQIAAFVEHAQLTGGEARLLGPAEECMEDETERTLDEVLDTLRENERKVVRAIFFERKTRVQVARDNNVSVTRIAQLELTALRKLRHPTRARRLQEVCDFTQHEPE